MIKKRMRYREAWRRQNGWDEGTDWIQVEERDVSMMLFMFLSGGECGQWAHQPQSPSTNRKNFLTEKFLYFILVLLTLNLLLKFNFGSKNLLTIGT